ncbi:fetal and adult testis-expressed transcript protein [Sagmatias obliquidens]|uniref:fetal and adult testis-expressed transcript protein n=1 Tax=Sagmatias obliquidens TaxID=3371155 RepID=UPI000F4421AE|nr:fetal and adult testis-expressed transcript protein [Lagenorhynchus obliquidens]
MAGGPPNIKEDIEMSMAEELVPAKMKGQGSQSLGVSQKQQKLDLKAAGSAAVWNMPATWSKKVVLNPEADMVAEIGLEELNGLEMEVMRRQLPVITGLRAVEDQGAAWRHREAVFFAMLLPTCIANLWLWMHQCGLHTMREFLSLRGLWYF